MENKGPLILGGVLVTVFLPLIIVVALMVGSLMSLPADATDCGPPSGGGKSFSWPTTSQKVDVPFTKDKHEGLDFNVALKSPVVAAFTPTLVDTSIDGALNTPAALYARIEK